MQMQGSRQLPASAKEAWDALNDPEVLKQCIPGCQKFELESDHTYNTAAQIKIGPVSAKFTGKVTLSDIEPPHRYTLNFEAQGGVAGHGKGVSHVSLVENDQGVELNYTVESQIGGKLAQLGQRLIDGAAKSMADDFFKRFEKVLADRNQPDSSAVESTFGGNETAEPVSRPEQSPGKGGVPRWLWIAIAAAVAIAVYANSAGT